jgi:hypothetical protein
MNCTKCGQPLELGATFCGNCGQQVAPIAQNAPVPDTAIANQVPVQTTVNQESANMVNAINNQAPSTGQNNLIGGPIIGVTGGVGMTPVYAQAAPQATNSGEKQAIAALIFGIIGIPASLIPIAGLLLGITGLVLSTTIHRKYKHTITTLAIVFSSIAIVVAIGSWVYAIHVLSKARQGSSGFNTSSTSTSNNSNTPASTTTTSGGGLTAVVTPCYSTKLESGLSRYTPIGCDINSSGSDQLYLVNAGSSQILTNSTLATIGPKSIQDGANAVGATITSQGLGTFANSPAYIGYLSKDGQTAEVAAVFHKSLNGDNLFIVGHFINSSQKATFGKIESNWQWK